MPRAANIRVTPERMTRLLSLPEGHQVHRFSVQGDGAVHCLVMGNDLPETYGAAPLVFEDFEDAKQPPEPQPMSWQHPQHEDEHDQ